MSSDYRRDHILSVKNDEYERLGAASRAAIATLIDGLEAAYPLPVAGAGETKALERACARYLIDSGKASTAGEV